MIVFVAGMPRAGSMWTYNVTRALYSCNNLSVIPKKIPKNETALITEALRSPETEGSVYCIKTHFKLPNPVPTRQEVKIICNIRDIRDACLSYKRFMRVDFQACLNAMVDMMAAADYYMQSFTDNKLAIRYEELGDASYDAIGKIAAFLGLRVTGVQKDTIWSTYKKSSVRQRLDKFSEIEVDNEGRVIGAEDSERFDAVRNPDGTYRIFDKETSFQTNHITSTMDGEWKSSFSAEEIEKINAVSREWLLKYNYEI